eukprot:CAMPEP_0172512624 /NCGR_PEP_ID=MMETSP1066-20121228/246005_1 /TAXON_ID=671091 /ORGANISM="Coscinodiscus wailesii, Strain CCMP2513" /LENGTH=355 /DNA_ID=CAMNT_0013292529 /DNA_START=160 /DNA_END=1227 /DNA_ORIENTATION=-
MSCSNLTFKWTKLEPHPDPTHGLPLSRSSHQVAVVPSLSSPTSITTSAFTVYVLGGENVARTPLPSDQFLWSYSPVSNSWRSINPENAPTSRVGHAGAYCPQDNKIYIFGGRTGVDMGETALADFWSFDCETQTWEEIQQGDGAPEPRSFHRMICVDNALFLFGGCGSSGRLSDLHKFDIKTRKWVNFGSSQVLRGRGGASFMRMPQGQSLAVVSGFAGEETNDGHVFDIAEGQWLQKGMDGLESLRPRSVSVAMTLNKLSKMVIFGGEVDPSDKGHDGAGGFEGDFVILDGESGTFETVVKNGEGWPEKRGWADGDVWEDNDASSLFLFGGLAGDDDTPRRLGDLWRCDFGLKE